MLNWNTILTKTAEHYRKYPEAAGYKTDGASKEAAEKQNANLSKTQQTVYDFVERFMPTYATPYKLHPILAEHGIKWTVATVKARFSELTRQGKFKKIKGLRDMSFDNTPCDVWQLSACNLTHNKGV